MCIRDRRLEDQVIKRTEKLKESNELLSNSMKELDEFNRILSHDLIEPLRSIISFSQLASRDIQNPENVQEYLSYVTNSGIQLSQLIKDVLLYRESDNIINETKVDLSISTVFSEIEYEIKDQWPDKQIKLICNTDATILCAAKTAKNVFKIIVENAVRFNNQDVVNIKVDYNKEGAFHTFIIQDNGIGIDPKYHDPVSYTHLTLPTICSV